MTKPDLSELVITRIRSIATVYTESNTYYKRPARECWGLIYKWEGETEYITESGKRTLSNADHPVLIPKGCIYEWTCTKAGRFSGIDFDADLVGEEILRLSAGNSERLLGQFQRLEHIRMLGQPFWQMEVLEGTYHLLAQLLRAEKKSYLPQDMAKMVQPALEYILQHYDQPITNDELAEMTGLSTVYFRKLFTKAVGTSPIRYIQGIRIRKAKEILRSDHGSISDVARTLGYQNIYHFSKAFKAQTGYSPSAFIKAEFSEPK